MPIQKSKKIAISTVQNWCDLTIYEWIAWLLLFWGQKMEVSQSGCNRLNEVSKPTGEACL